MRELLLIFTLCGTPQYIVVQDAKGYIAGSPSQAPQEALERIKRIIDKKRSVIDSIPLEELTGLRCT